MRRIHFIVADAPMRRAVGLERIHGRRLKSQHGRVVNFSPRSCQCLRIDQPLLRAGREGQHPHPKKNPTFHRNFLFINPLPLKILHTTSATCARRASSTRQGTFPLRFVAAHVLQHGAGNVWARLRARGRAGERRGTVACPGMCLGTCWGAVKRFCCTGAISLRGYGSVLARDGERFPCVSCGRPRAAARARGTVMVGFVP